MGELERFAPEDIETTWRRAKGYALSGYFADAKSAEQAFVKISAGAEMGLTPFQSMSGIFIISGKPVVGAGLLAAMLDQHPDYDYTVKWDPDFENAEACTITVSKNGKERGESRFSIDDAKRAGLMKTGGMYDKFPPNMLYARAMSNAVRWYAPGVTGTSTYVEGEIPTFEAPQHAEAKPRTRVTAEVITDAEVFDPATEPDPPVVKPPGPLAEPLAAGPLPLRVQLTHLSVQEKADLWNFAGLERNTKMADVKARLIAYADELGLDFTEEPDARGILDAARAATKGNGEAFDIFAKTGQDVDPGDQVEFNEVMT